MKSVIISIAIAALIVAGSLFYTKNLDKVSEELRGINGKISEYIEGGDYFAADAEIDRLVSRFNSRRAVLDMIGDHEETDKIEINLYELTEYSRGQKQTDALSRCRVLDFLFEHLPQNYRLKFENIL